MEMFGRFMAWCLVFTLGILAAYLSASLVAQLWEWFVVPLGMKEIGAAQAYGLILLFGYFNIHPTLQLQKLVDALEDGKSAMEKATYSLAMSYMVLGLTLSIGWFVHGLM